jgi:hypothetical protein
VRNRRYTVSWHVYRITVVSSPAPTTCFEKCVIPLQHSSVSSISCSGALKCSRAGAFLERMIFDYVESLLQRDPKLLASSYANFLAAFERGSKLSRGEFLRVKVILRNIGLKMIIHL